MSVQRFWCPIALTDYIIWGLVSYWILRQCLKPTEHRLGSHLSAHPCRVSRPFPADFPCLKLSGHVRAGLVGTMVLREQPSFWLEAAQQLSLCSIEKLVVRPSISESPRHHKAVVCVCDLCAVMMLGLSHCCRSPGVRISKTFYRSSGLPWCLEFCSLPFLLYCRPWCI